MRPHCMPAWPGVSLSTRETSCPSLVFPNSKRMTKAMARVTDRCKIRVRAQDVSGSEFNV